jgi:hypothetical protein
VVGTQGFCERRHKKLTNRSEPNQTVKREIGSQETTASPTMVRFVMLSLSVFFFASAPHGACADNDVAVLRNLHSSPCPEWKPRGIVNVGIHSGGWSRCLQQEHPSVTTFVVDASSKHAKSPEEAKKQLAPNVHCEIAILSKKDGDTIEFHDTGGAGDSMFVENSVHFKDVKPVQRTAAELDMLASCGTC